MTVRSGSRPIARVFRATAAPGCREELEYGGVRLRGAASLSGARIAVVVDVGFGDSVEPRLETIDYPALLDLPAPKLRAYAPETVIAEKFQAMVALGRANSRMKDFYDIWILSKTFDFAPERLARAVAATFARRRTVIPTDRPDALTEDFAEDPLKQRQWAAFVADIDHAPRQLALRSCAFPHGCRSAGAPPVFAITVIGAGGLSC
jgi:Nucleotidyl transferase AbiEii toxin, Type IV TA system